MGKKEQKEEDTDLNKPISLIQKQQEESTDLNKSISLIKKAYKELIIKTYFKDKQDKGNEDSSLSKLRKEILSDGENTCFFPSRLHELAFYFNDSAKKEHSNYDEELKITPIHVIKIEKARELRKAYLSIFNSTARANLALHIGIDFTEVEQNITKTFILVTRGKLK